MHLSRNRTLVLGTFAIALLAFGIRLLSVPDEYEASALIVVEPQKVPDSYVHSTVIGIGLRLGIVKKRLMSYTHLQRIMTTYNLYPSLKGHETQEQILDRMRSDIGVEVVHGFDGTAEDGVRAFRISYRGDQPKLVAQVCNDLASMFIAENLKDREQQAMGASEFIGIQLSLAKKALELAKQSIVTAKSKEDHAVATLELAALQENYVSLVKKKLEADTAVSLELRQEGERLMLLDQARIPEKPISRRNLLRAGW